MSPAYDFKCPQCGGVLTIRKAITENIEPPICGDCLVGCERVFSATPAHFKGSGWGGSK